MSPETKEVMNSIADDLYADLVNAVAKGAQENDPDDPGHHRRRAVPFETGADKGLVDELRYEDEMFGELKAAAECR